MVDADLQDATSELVGEIVQFDIMSLLTGGTSLVGGLFAGEVIGRFVRGMLAGQRTIIQTLAGLISRVGFSAALILARRFTGPLGDVVLGMAAFGNIIGILFEILEGAANLTADLLAGKELVGAREEESRTLGAGGYENPNPASNPAPSASVDGGEAYPTAGTAD